MGTFREMAGVAADPVMDLSVVRNASPILHAIQALILLLTATGLGVYKPLGMTDYGRRKLDERRFAVTTLASTATEAVLEPRGNQVWIYVAGAIAIGLALLVVILHLTGLSPTHH
jgi:hypothetical protein